jgi:hypothetical protein
MVIAVAVAAGSDVSVAGTMVGVDAGVKDASGVGEADAAPATSDC